MDNSIQILKTIANSMEGVTSFHFLHSLNKYLETINNDTFLSKVLLLMREYHQQEILELAKMANVVNSDLYLIQNELENDINMKYPLYFLRQLMNLQKDFQYIKQYEGEHDIPDIEITVPYEDPYLTSKEGTKLQLRRIVKRVELLEHRRHFTEFHEAFIKFIDEIIEKGGIFSKYFDYDKEKGVLYFKEKEIEINERKKLTNAHYLLSYLFSNDPFEQHFYSELEEESVLLENKSWSSYYHTCEDIQKKVNEKTGIADFLDFSSGPKMYVRINPAYSMKNT